jgi:putative transposase
MRATRHILAPKKDGGSAKYARREIVSALLSVARTGCQWRALPHTLPSWRIVSWYVMAWKTDGALDRLLDELRRER